MIPDETRAAIGDRLNRFQDLVATGAIMPMVAQQIADDALHLLDENQQLRAGEDLRTVQVPEGATLMYPHQDHERMNSDIRAVLDAARIGFTESDDTVEGVRQLAVHLDIARDEVKRLQALRDPSAMGTLPRPALNLEDLDHMVELLVVDAYRQLVMSAHPALAESDAQITVALAVASATCAYLLTRMEAECPPAAAEMGAFLREKNRLCETGWLAVFIGDQIRARDIDVAHLLPFSPPVDGKDT